MRPLDRRRSPRQDGSSIRPVRWARRRSLERGGRGISHAIGTGGRDLKAEVGAITTLMAIDALDADDRTQHVVLISKPPAAAVAKAVLARVARSSKPFTICFLGTEDFELPSN